MARLNALNPAEATGKAKELFDGIQGKLGVVPNMMRTMGNSPAFLKGYLDLSGALALGSLNAVTGELIAMAVAESNSCDYCLSAHTYIGINLVKADAQALQDARTAQASNPKTAAILKFAQVLVAKSGRPSDADLAAVRNAGASEGEVGEIVGHVALNILTNYLNNTAQTEIDFPAVHAHEVAVV